MEEDDDMTPFWLQSSNDGRLHRRRRQASSLLLNTGILVVLLLVIAFAFIFVIIPSFLSFTSQIFKPHLVKKSWDSLNLVLVLFAIICAFLSKSDGSRDNDSPSPTSYHQDYKFSTTPKHVRRSNPSTPRQWYDYPSSSSSSFDRTATFQRLRSSSSYPDLRLQDSSNWMINGDDDRWRFYDDTHLYNHNYRTRSRREREREHGQEEEVYGGANSKDIAVDTVQTTPPPPSSPPRAPSPPPPAAPEPEAEPEAEAEVVAASPPRPPRSPPLQPPKAVRRKPKRIYEDVKPRERSERKEVVNSELKIKHSLPPPPPAPPARPPPSPPPPPPPPPPAVFEKRSSKSEKKRGGATKDFLISLRRRKKKQRQKSVENLEEFFNLSTLPLHPPPSPPPPPPPPPPPLPSFYQSIFSSKKSRARKSHSVPPSSPPPPPPQPQPSSLEARASRRESQKPPVTTQKPPLPVRIRNIHNVDESVESGGESPLNPIPPPPPPPPFKMPAWKFEVHGDFVRLKSIRGGSPDLDDPLSGEASPSDGESAAGPLFCPSPDVNTKADNFIARFRAGLKLEKMNSVTGRSNLGPDPGPSTV